LRRNYGFNKQTGDGMTLYDRYRREHKVKNFFPYHPVSIRREPNPNHTRISRLIIRLKDKNNDAIQKIVDEIIGKLPVIDMICSIPSSNACETQNGIRLASQIISKQLGIVDGTECLIRATSRDRSCAGNRSSIDSHMKTMALQNQHLIKGRRILLLDDVTTSGATLVAGAQMLKMGGAALVSKYALGATVYYGH